MKSIGRENDIWHYNIQRRRKVKQAISPIKIRVKNRKVTEKCLDIRVSKLSEETGRKTGY